MAATLPVAPRQSYCANIYLATSSQVFRDDIKEKVEGAEGEGYKPKPDVTKWIEDVQKLENEWEVMQESIAAAKMLAYKCCPKCSLRSEVGENFGSNLVVENYRVKKVDHILVPSIEGQSTATRNLSELLHLLEDDKSTKLNVYLIASRNVQRLHLYFCKTINPLRNTPRILLAFPALRVLNLSQTGITELPSSINSLCQLRALIVQRCFELKELAPVANLHNLQVLDCENTELRCLPQRMDNLTNLRLLNMCVADLSISEGFFLNLPSIEMLNMSCSCLGATSFNEISSLHNLTYLSIGVDSSSFFNRDYTWMTRLKGFLVEVGETSIYVPYNKSKRVINVNKCEIFSNGELSGMLQFASDLY
ncbi:hypothetical protein P3L10_003879 [Capsicum annuum]